jgi:hypothetical protein
MSFIESAGRDLTYTESRIVNDHNLLGSKGDERIVFPYDAERKPGRPKVIPKSMVPKIIALYKQGRGYRAISHELKKKNLSVNWSTVRRLIKKNIWIYTPCKNSSCSDVAPAHSINKDWYYRRATNCSKKEEASKCTFKPVDLPRFRCK